MAQTEIPCPNLTAGVHSFEAPSEDCMLCFGTDVMTLIDGKLINPKSNKIACPECHGEGNAAMHDGVMVPMPCLKCGTMGNPELIKTLVAGARE